MNDAERFEQLTHVEPNTGCVLWLGQIIHGHSLSGDNLVGHPEYRRCRTCKNDIQRRYKERRSQTGGGRDG